MVDEDVSVLSTLKQLLSDEGHNVITASGGPEALRLCREYNVHLILLEYSMPDLTGEALVRQVRAFDQEVQIVLQTSCAPELPARQMLHDLEIQGYHDKSEGPEKLLVWVDTALKAFRAKRAIRVTRDGLRYILRVTPELHRLQPLDDLMRSILLQAQGLLGLSGAFVASLAKHPELANNAFLAIPDRQKFLVRVGTGRFEGKTWETLESSEKEMVLATAKTGQMHKNSALGIPLLAGDRIVGVIFIELSLDPAVDAELLEIFASQAAIAIENVRLYELATVDDLTQLSTRRHWLHHLENTLRLALRYGHPTSLVMMDIDHFKELNDVHGHLAGDLALASAGRAVKERIRRSDVAGRYGGEEFVITLPHTDSAGAQKLAAYLREGVANLAISWENQALRLTASTGVATVLPIVGHRHAPSEELVLQARKILVRTADDALLRAKQQGRDRIEVAEPITIEAAETVAKREEYDRANT